MIKDRAQVFERLRHSHSAWQLLASRRAPLVLASFEQLFEDQAEISLEDGIQHLGDLFLEFKNVHEFSVELTTAHYEARKEIRQWIKKKLIVERNGMLSQTDALQRAIEFVQGLDEQIMTSTATRLLTVQEIIERLAMQINPEKESRVTYLKRKIRALEKELKRAKKGKFKVMDEPSAIEGVKEVYLQGMSLKSDFRRVEDSYREADYALRKEITKANKDRGEVLDDLLDSHDALLKTPEGAVFNAFYEQLQERTKLEAMKQQLRTILQLPFAKKALSEKQNMDLSELTYSLLDDSSRVIDARIRGERDVKSFVKTGLASENFRIGSLINDLMDEASSINWDSQKVAGQGADLPPVGIAVTNLPLIQRFLVKGQKTESDEELNLEEQTADDILLDDGFWASYRSLDRSALFQKTLKLLKKHKGEVPISELAGLCETEHDLETVSYWLSLAREAKVEFSGERETFQITHEETVTEFDIPKVALSSQILSEINQENLD